MKAYDRWLSEQFAVVVVASGVVVVVVVAAVVVVVVVVGGVVVCMYSIRKQKSLNKYNQIQGKYSL